MNVCLTGATVLLRPSGSMLTTCAPTTSSAASVSRNTVPCSPMRGERMDSPLAAIIGGLKSAAAQVRLRGSVRCVFYGFGEDALQVGRAPRSLVMVRDGIQSLTIAGMLGQPLPSPENGLRLRTATQMGDERARAPTTLARRPTVPFAVGGQTQRAEPELGSVVLPRILRFEKRRDGADPCVEAGDLCPRQRGGQCLPFPFWGGAMLFHAATSANASSG